MIDKKKKFTEWMKHIIDCNSYGNTINEKTLDLLRKVYDEINRIIKSRPYISSKIILNEISDEIESVLNKYAKDYKKVLKNEINDIAAAESEWLQDFMASLGIGIVIPATIVSSLKFTPIINNSDYLNLVDSTILDIRDNVTSLLKNAYVMKNSTDIVSEKITARQSRMEKTVTTDTEAFNTSVFDTTDYLIFKSNDQKVVYSSMLDSHTCPECAMLDGQRFDIKEAPLLPLHYNCRCVLIPDVICDDEQPTYKEWFESLEDEDKKDILGKKRFEMYQKGFPLSRFVNNGKLISLKELTTNIETDKN